MFVVRLPLLRFERERMQLVYEINLLNNILRNHLGAYTVRPVNILHFLFIFKNRKSKAKLLFSFSCLKIYRYRTLIDVKHIALLNCQLRSPMPIYIRKKNVKIFKLYQNCRNDVQINSTLRKKEKKIKSEAKSLSRSSKVHFNISFDKIFSLI